VVALAVAATGLLVGAGPAAAADPVTSVLDRTNSTPADVPPAVARAQDRLRSRLGEGALLQTDAVTGTPRILARLDGFLTPPSSRDPESIALDYVRNHAEAFGLDSGDIATLRLTSNERGSDGTVHLSWEQRAGGLSDVDGGLQAAVSAGGQLLNVRGGVVPDLDKDAPQPLVGAATAYATALPGDAPAPPASVPSGAERTTSFAGGGTASLVRYQDNGTDRLGWRLLLPAGSDAYYDALVDARAGTLQRRFNRVRLAGEINHFDVNPRAPGDAPTTSEVSDEWLLPGTDRLIGPYVHAVSDVDGDVDATEPPTADDEVRETDPADRWWYAPKFGSGEGFCEPLCSWRDNTNANRTANREFSTAQLFWYVNTFHDHLAAPPIGFTSSSGGFEAGADHVLAQSLDGALRGKRNNATMLTLPDGQGALMEVDLFRFDVDGAPTRYDGSHDAGLVYHEYAHALSDRLVVGADGLGALFGAQGTALAEGFSDFYALDFLAETEPAAVQDTATPGEVRFGRWLGEVRTEAVDCAVGQAGPTNECPGTETAGAGGYDYGDFGEIGTDPVEPHDNGEIWAQTLWSVRTAITGADATSEELARVRRYITDGLRLAPDYPTFLEMRNAILQAAFNATGGQDLVTLWQVFASRGMGWSATDGTQPVPAFDMPPPPVVAPPPPPPTPSPAPTPTPGPGPVAKLTSLSGARLTADSRGFFKVKVRFGDAAPPGKARFTVTRKGKRLARATTPVRQGKTVTKTLRLTRKGRKAIRRGRSKRVVLELRLPGGEKVKKTMRLARKKR
jgi:extracellular elastinolytic metalloproteinase